MYTSPANTLFMGNQIISLPECHSTNDFAAEKLQEPTLSEGTVIITDRQTRGRGQRGAEWVAAPGTNLTFSCVLRPTFLPISAQFQLNMVISLAILDVVAEITHKPVYIKWPNDIVVDDKKICGILIENQLRGSVFASSIAGIGLNVNQQQFPFEGPTSLALLTGHTFDLDEVLGKLLHVLETHYVALRQGNAPDRATRYREALYWRNERHTFTTLAGEVFDGSVRDVDQAGRLQVETDQGIRLFSVKEIVYTR